MHVWKPSKTKSKSVARGRQTTRGYSVLLVLTRGHDVSHSADALSARYRKFSLPFSHLAPLFRVTLFELMEKLHGSWNWSLPGSRQWRFGDPSLHHFWLIHPCDRWTNGQTELRWLRCATAVPAVARKNWHWPTQMLALCSVSVNDFQ